MDWSFDEAREREDAMIEYVQGDTFDSTCDVLVCPVNCVASDRDWETGFPSDN